MAKKMYTVRFRQEFVDAWTRYTGTFSDHCQRWNVSRESGYDWLEKVRLGGFAALESKSSAPHHCPHETSDDVVELVIAARKLHPTWGPRKLRPWLLTRHPDAELPAPSTMGEILKRAGLVPKRRRRQRMAVYSAPFANVEAPNDVWTTDFKGQFHTRDGKLCYPLTIADAYSRFFLRCDGYLKPDESSRKSFESAFIEFGLPGAIRSDNGTPFCGSRAPAGLSALSVWWIRLGITPERIEPASPWQNGRHERMHRTLKDEATHPAARIRRLPLRIQSRASARVARPEAACQRLQQVESAVPEEAARGAVLRRVRPPQRYVVRPLQVERTPPLALHHAGRRGHRHETFNGPRLGGLLRTDPSRHPARRPPRARPGPRARLTLGHELSACPEGSRSAVDEAPGQQFRNTNPKCQ